MRWWQIRRHLRGLQRRHRETWESTRWQAMIIGRFLGVKADGDELRTQDLLTLPWDDDEAETSRSKIDDAEWQKKIETLRKKIKNGEIK